MTFRVAVIVRTKDRPFFLARALADIAAQTFVAAEAVVVNDGGDPVMVRKVAAASGLEGRVRVLDTQGTTGRCAAANQGLASTDAPFVVLHDDDDYWDREFLARTVAHLEAHPEQAGVMVRTEIVVEERAGSEWVVAERYPFWASLTAVDFTSLLTVNRAVPISFLYRRELHEEVGYYDESLETVEDWDFYLRIAARHPLGFISDRILAFWTHRPGARGHDGNSMFELASQHRIDDRLVRDRALRAWADENGMGLPLYLARLEQDLHEHIDRRHDETQRLILERIARAEGSRLSTRVARRARRWMRELR